MYKYILEKMDKKSKTKKYSYINAVIYFLLTNVGIGISVYRIKNQSNIPLDYKTISILILLGIYFAISYILTPITSSIYNIERANAPDYDEADEMAKRYEYYSYTDAIFKPFLKYQDFSTPVIFAIPLYLHYSRNQEKYINKIEAIEKRENNLHFSILGIRYNLGL